MVAPDWHMVVSTNQCFGIGNDRRIVRRRVYHCNLHRKGSSAYDNVCSMIIMEVCKSSANTLRLFLF